MPKPEQGKSIKRVKKEATQEFFNKKRSGSSNPTAKADKTAFTFNKAPINKDDAKRELLEEKESRPNKRSAFTAKLYRDDNELEELKVLGGDQFDSDLDEKAKQPLKARDAKAQSKSKQKQDFTGQNLLMSKIGRLAMTKGSVAMFAISEVNQGQYAIVTHTRNVKGFISLKDKKDFNMKPGQLIIACVMSVGLGITEEGHTSKKLQLSIEPADIYRTFNTSKVTQGMFLQATVESKEEKGYFLNMGFKDGAKGFLKFSKVQYNIGDIVQVTAQSVTNKLIKCDSDLMACVQTTESVLVNEHTLRPGFLVNAKIAKLYENGVEISFLGGMTGTVFVDHTGRDSIQKFKVGEKLKARVTAHDIQTKITTLSLLDHIVSQQPKQLCEIGQVFEKVKVQKLLYGGSYQLNLGVSQGFLHKSHLPGAKQSAQDDEQTEKDSKEKKSQQVVDELTVGQVVDKVRVKELNFFDGTVHVTMRQQIVNSPALNYSSIEVGQFVNATIDSVNEVKKIVTLSLNDFVKGTLRLEHMADYPIKVIPPKFAQTGKQIKVRVFSLEERSLVFTKKDSLMKHDVPIFKSLKSVKKGEKVIGVVVAQNDHGFIIKSFGDVKGLLNFSDVKENQSKKEKGEIKVGSIVKSYVLFNKKGSGLALTLDKKIARKDEDSKTEGKTLTSYFPTEDELKELKETYSSMLKHSGGCVGKVFNFKLTETRQNFYIVQSVLEKKQKLAILPKPLSSAFGLRLPFEEVDFTFEAFVFQEYENLPIIVVNPLIASLKDSIPKQQSDLQAGKAFLGIVEGTSSTLGVQIKFPEFTSYIAIKDLQQTDNISANYPIGNLILSVHNKSGRLSCKNAVLSKVISADALQSQRQALLNAFTKLQQDCLCVFKIGQKITATVQLVKDYGLILKVDDVYTGFIVNDQRASTKSQKVGQQVIAIVLDVDYEKKIIDLSERLVGVQTEKSKQLEPRAIVELTKDNYMIVSLKGNRSQFGICLLQQFINDNNLTESYGKFQVGEEIDVQFVPNKNEVKSELLQMTLKVKRNNQTHAQIDALKEGAVVNGTIKSIKEHAMFIQIGYSGKLPQIGRLLRVESQQNDMVQSKVGDRISVKILRVVNGKLIGSFFTHIHIENGKSWIELTRRKEHLDLPSGILSEKLTQLLQLDTIKEGTILTGFITDVSLESSTPVQFQVSPFVSGRIVFSDIVTPELLQKHSLAKIISQYKVGGQIEVVYRNGQFTTSSSIDQKQFKKGDLCVVRYVKVQPGYGVTVQLSNNAFGVIEICELSDEIIGNVVKQMKLKNIFLARVIDTDKKGRLMLSSRESLVTGWSQIFGNSTAQFQQFDSKNQKQGNLRNKILKFGPKLSINQGDLFTGYVTNISKAGCFIQLGHNCSIRVGLNELDDTETFDFKHQMPIGRLIVGRITKCIDLGEEMRYNASTRKSLVLYGVHQVNRNQLKIDDIFSCYVLAVSNEAIFAQLKGSYLRLKVYGAPSNIEVGSFVDVKLTKVQVENIKGNFIGKSAIDANQDQTVVAVYESVLEESRLDIAAASEQAQNEIDLEEVVAKNRNNSKLDEQIRDLETLAQLQNEQDDSDDEEMASDSDAEDMKRIISKNYEEQDDSDQSMMSDDEEGESEQDDDDEEMESDSEEQYSDQSQQDSEDQPLKGKKALREQITQEKKIRAKEAQIRSKSGGEPQTINDFERLLVADQDQSYLWIQYMAFMLDKLDIEAARRVAERAVKSIGMTAEEDKLNLWIAFMNLENQFGTDDTLQSVIRRALEINDNRKVYLQVVNLYRTSNKTEHVEAIYKKLCKKYYADLDIWTSYIEFLFECPKDQKFTEAKVILQRSLQALPKNLHINIISKYGMLEYKHGRSESGRTMFEGIVSNYPKRMDIWSIYMDMEVKYGGKENAAQARNLFERCLSLNEIQKKPKSMKLVFRKYMEFENQFGSKQKLDQLRQRVEQYLESAFKKSDDDSESQNNSSGSESSDDQ